MQHSHTPNDETYVEHCVTLENHEGRIAAMEKTVDSMNELIGKINSIVSGLKILKPIVYAILGISILAFLGALFDHFTEQGRERAVEQMYLHEQPRSPRSN